ncbi:Membrane protein involved in the export of O-antigen and teichoic acid [Lachnospiraceae bacterium RM5]|nr:Membrane protein involved in the export of O-antigen and teichoic acid [Lachnospiraceae bacterium RM5]
MHKFIARYKKLPVQAKASIWFLVCSFMQKGVTTITTPIFTRLMTTSEYGNYSVFNSWMGIISIFVTLQIYSGLFEQGLVKFESDRKVFCSSLQGLNLVLCVFCTVVYIPFHRFWNSIFTLTTVQMLAMLALIWTSAVFRFWSAEQRVRYKYKNLVLVTLFVSTINPVISVFLVIHAQDKVTARILGLLIAELIGYTGLFFSQMKRGRVFYSRHYWKYAILFALPLVPHYLAQIVLASSDRIMIQRMVGESEAGIYSLAYTISSVMTLFNTALSQTISPWIYSKIKNNKLNDISGMSYLTMGIIGILNILLILFAPEIVRMFAPPSYYEAIWVVPPVALSIFFIFMYDFFAKFEFYYEKKFFIMIASVIGAVLNIVLNYVFISLFGYVAAGYTTLICYIAYVVGHYLFMRKVVRDNCGNIKIYDPKILLLMSSLIIVCGLVFSFTYLNDSVRYVLIFIIFIICIIFRKRILKEIKKVILLRKSTV